MAPTAPITLIWQLFAAHGSSLAEFTGSAQAATVDAGDQPDARTKQQLAAQAPPARRVRPALTAGASPGLALASALTDLDGQPNATGRPAEPAAAPQVFNCQPAPDAEMAAELAFAGRLVPSLQAGARGPGQAESVAAPPAPKLPPGPMPQNARQPEPKLHAATDVAGNSPKPAESSAAPPVAGMARSAGEAREPENASARFESRGSVHPTADGTVCRDAATPVTAQAEPAAPARADWRAAPRPHTEPTLEAPAASNTEYPTARHLGSRVGRRYGASGTAPQRARR